jgi:pyruvate,orthophosphate dikinase
MQIRAIFEATAELISEKVDVKPQIMIPQVSTFEELKEVKKLLDPIKKNIEEAFGFKIPFKFGTMIEVVRACVTADEIAKEVEFFSFGTNDLTQGTFSFSREDAENKFIPVYFEKGILSYNPFHILDVKGVGHLMEIAVNLGRKSNPELEIGICGEHGGEPSSIIFCHNAGLNYVSCSPYRVPIARLVAAQQAIRKPRE